MATSKFLESGKTYIGEAASYLESRGLTIQDLPIVPHKTTNLGFHTKSGEDYIPFVPEGWAYKIRHPEGDYYDDRWLLRVCNWPEEQLYQRQGKSWAVMKGKPPKFVQVSTRGADCTNYVSTIDELCHSNVIMIHEKYTSAALCKNLLGFPCIALSGCTNWSSEGKLREQMADMVRLLKPDCHIVVCFDGDLVENVNVMNAASQLKGWIGTIRDDVKVSFPLVPQLPDGMNGWDDYTVFQGANARQSWLELIANNGVDVSSALPLQYLISKFQVKVKALKDKLLMEHTPENYRRLLGYSLWANYVQDTGGDIYDISTMPLRALTFDDLLRKYEAWLADVPFAGDGASVGHNKVSAALKEELSRRTMSIPMYLLAQQPPVTHAQALQAAHRLATEGLKVLGPMCPDQTAITLLRVARDMVALWSNDRYVDVQWALALVGPSGCGKSNFPKSFISCLDKWGYHGGVAQLAKEGSRANLDELFRQCRDSLVGVFDEYNPDERSARQVEQNLFTLSTTRIFKQRKLHEESARDEMRRAAIMLTTVDRNRNYVRSAKGAGERRFITLDVMGVKMWSGRLTSDREVIAACGETLLTYGYQMYLEGSEGTATEFSEQYTADYISESGIIAKLSAVWSRMDIQAALDKFGQEQFRKGSNDWRFTMAQLQGLLLGDEKLGRLDKGDFHAQMLDLGVEEIGKARVNTPSGETYKDRACCLKDWEKWCLDLRAKL